MEALYKTKHSLHRAISQLTISAEYLNENSQPMQTEIQTLQTENTRLRELMQEVEVKQRVLETKLIQVLQKFRQSLSHPSVQCEL